MSIVYPIIIIAVLAIVFGDEFTDKCFTIVVADAAATAWALSDDYLIC